MPDSVRQRKPLFVYLLALAAVALTTQGMLSMQVWLSSLTHRHVRPYSIVFIIPIALLTLLGGRAPGFFTLLLASLLTATILLSPRLAGGVNTPTGGMELTLLLVTGTLVILGMDAMRRNVQVLRQEQEAQAQLRTVMDTSPVGMVTCDMDGTLRYANPAAERIWGHSLIGFGRGGEIRSRMLNPDGTPIPPGETTLGRVLSGEAVTLAREMILEQPGGNRLWVGASSTLICDGAGRATGGLLVLQDITARKQAQAEEEEARAAAEARAEREALLNRIGEEIRSSTDADEILRRVTEALGEALGLDRCYFITYDMNLDRAALGPDWCRPPLASIAGEFRMSAFQINRAPDFLAGGVQRVDDTLADGPNPLLMQLRLRALLRVALRRGAQMTALTGAMAHEPRAWTAEEAALLADVATLTRTALDLSQVRRREQTIAATLQDALRPRLPERVPGLDLAEFYQPALDEASVGGDFFDVFPLDKGLYALVVGDVSGKGLAAAAQVATVRHMLRYALYQQMSVADAVTDLNRVTSAQDLLTGFVTMFVGVYDTTICELRYVSCGHEPALVRRADGALWELEPTGPVLGAADLSVYHERSVTLGPGDVLALYTDGISEAGRNRQDFWGVAGLSECLSTAPPEARAVDLVAHIMAGAVGHAQGAMHDDVCLLIGIVESNGEPLRHENPSRPRASAPLPEAERGRDW